MTVPEQELFCLLAENRDPSHTNYGILSPRRVDQLQKLLPEVKHLSAEARESIVRKFRRPAQ